ncbi:hypothetical protein GGS23DRAFT_595005 [Durotheca rogersii]|uniref:uncharacterized protein n=1 Tax=Durotheca rogersii TaxID=419775 RepID=UPI00221EA2A2|nr:uncharacterized protein GGS23DRAFT_595005 [Durotheca rogersii]KAI5865484.1 hypothetical protein GGS23DRAFT_595005 [Durotheca rogersii]
MEGTLLVPPDRGTIIGRAAWKPRYLVVGPQRDASQSNLSFSQVLSAARIKDPINRPKPQPRVLSDAVYLSIYKAKDDWELVQQHSITSVTECQVQTVSHRKQGPAVPTLAVQVLPDPATDKLRKRRSSRTAGLTTTKESGPTTLWFRLGDDRTYTLEDWARCIKLLIHPEGQLDLNSRQPMSPISPVSPTFINPFAPSPSRDANDSFAGASSGSSAKTRAKMPGRPPSHAHAPSRDGNATFTTGTPSIRSQRSDMSSSHASSMVPLSTGHATQQHAAVRSSDLPSPATTIAEYQDQFIEGWTSAQGRASTLSSPIRLRESTSSAQGQYLPSISSNSPPAPRETILDRAFQLRCIPGSDREVPGEEKLSSLARFEALMREVEERQKDLDKDKMKTISKEPLKSTWEEESDEEDQVDEDDDSDADEFEHDIGTDEIAPSTQRALQFIANRHSSTKLQWSQGNSNEPLPNYQDRGASILRPHTANSRSRPTAQRTSSQPYIPSGSLEMPPPPPPSSRVIEEATPRRNHEKRHSTSDVKRLSFNEFTKRLSGTSSLLLVQTNASNGGGRGSGDVDGTSLQATPPRGGPFSPNERDERCRWRGSVGVFGTDQSGFL